MKPRTIPAIRRRLRHQEGNTLLLTLFTLIVLTSSLAGYLLFTNHNVIYSRRNDLWEGALHIAESGIEEAISHYKWNWANLASQGWTASATNYYKTTYVDDDYYTVYMSKTVPPVITAYSYVLMPTRGSYLTRKVQVTTKLTSGGFKRAITVKGQIEFNGNPLFVDSYDSSNPLYSTGGLYDVTKHKDNGDVAQNGTASFALGAGQVFGHLQSGPGGNVTSFAPGGAGDLAWFAAGKSGIKPGWFKDDANMNFPAVTVPGYSWTTLASTSATLGTGNYKTTSLNMSGSTTLNINGNVVLYVTSGINLSGNSAIVIAPGASLTIYISGGQANFVGGSVTTMSGNPKDLTLLATSGVDKFTFKPAGSTSPFIGTVYAPNAELEFGTGGSSGYQFIGGVVGLNIQLNGDWRYHYDESLPGIGPMVGGDLLVTSWNEL
ncbi:MAG TPA: hypothetical protein DCM86_03890 [Verrucomicrobiales bacterium]|nr:hypothetical protein [Verrucomicrobiales bacterium]